MRSQHPGALPTFQASNTPGSVNTGSGSFFDIRFSGRPNEQNAMRFDGIEGSAIIDLNPGYLNGELSSPFCLQTSLENVQKFRVDSAGYAAECGTGTGGQISVSTKSRDFCAFRSKCAKSRIPR